MKAKVGYILKMKALTTSRPSSCSVRILSALCGGLVAASSNSGFLGPYACLMLGLGSKCMFRTPNAAARVQQLLARCCETPVGLHPPASVTAWIRVTGCFPLLPGTASPQGASKCPRRFPDMANTTIEIDKEVQAFGRPGVNVK